MGPIQKKQTTSGNGREILLDTNPTGRPSLRDTVEELTQFRPNSPLRRRPPGEPLMEMTDAELGADRGAPQRLPGPIVASAAVDR
jgi:hypothetical protein